MKFVELSNGRRIYLNDRIIKRDGKPLVLTGRDKLKEDHWQILDILIANEGKKISRIALITEVRIAGQTLENKKEMLEQYIKTIRRAIGQNRRDRTTPQFIDSEKREGGGDLIFKRNPNGEVLKNSKTHKAAAPKIEKFVERRAQANGKSYVEILIGDLNGEGGEAVPALIGGVGVGKSAIVNEVGKTFANHNSKYIWSSAKKREYRLDDLFEDIIENSLGERNAHLLPIIKGSLNEEVVRQTIEKHKPCFLVLDALENVDEKDLIKCLDWIQKEIPNSAVVTSRKNHDYFKTRRIEEMTTDEAKEFVNNLKRDCSNINHSAEEIIAKANTKNPAVLRRAVELLETEGIKLEDFDSSSGENADGKINVKKLFKSVYDEIGASVEKILKALSKSPQADGIDREELITISEFNNRSGSFESAIRKLQKYKFVFKLGERFALTDTEAQIQEMIEEFEEKEFGGVEEL